MHGGADIERSGTDALIPISAMIDATVLAFTITTIAQFVDDPWGAVGPVGLGVYVEDLHCQIGSALLPLGRLGGGAPLALGVED
ncbi:hypothetical protein Kisp01_70690 [Kineosporia sp. NBRC 101677]|nr:hypothetical protein Kisp01_70690 [Kineosporia sp. NBRC 101677]